MSLLKHPPTAKTRLIRNVVRAILAIAVVAIVFLYILGKSIVFNLPNF